MKLMSKLLRKNDKGLSLVELICAIAILGLSTTAIGGAMVMSARHYQKDSAEFSIQQEAQLVTNQVGNLVVDAADANWNPTSKKFTVKSDNKTHVIYQNGDKLVYEQLDNAGVVVANGVLAEGVAANGFSVDDSAFATNKNVNISLTLDKDGRNITSDYNATSRNGKLTSFENAEQVAVINVEDVIVVEPQMTEANGKAYKTLLSVNGMSWDDVGGVVIDTSYGSIPGEFDVEIKTEGTQHYLYVEAGQYAAGSFPILLKTVKTKADGTTPLNEKVVTIKVRRIDGLSINNPSGTNITLGNNGTEFVLYAPVTGDNIAKGFGKKYDDAPYDYVNPRYVDFVVECPVGCDIEEYGDIDSPFVKITLTENMADGQQIKVTAYSKHAALGGNKSGVAYKLDVKDIYIIECDRPLPETPLPEFGDEGVLRGKDYNWGCTVPSVNTFKGSLEAKYGSEVTFNWYVRFSEKGMNSWTPYHITQEDGDNRKVSGTGETLYMLPDKAYDIQFFILYTIGNEIVFPHDDDLLSSGYGFTEAGFVKGWSDEDATATEFEQYGGQTSLEAVSLYYYNNSDSSDDFNNIGIDEKLNSVGNDGDGAVEFSIQDLKNNNSERKIYFDTLHLYRTSYDMTPVFWRKDGDNWIKLNSNTDKYILFNGEKCFQYQLDKNNGNLGFWYIYEQNDSDTVKENKKGTYRLGFELSGTYTTYQEGKATNNAFNNNTDLTWKLYDESGTDGFYYFEIKD